MVVRRIAIADQNRLYDARSCQRGYRGNHPRVGTLRKSDADVEGGRAAADALDEIHLLRLLRGGIPLHERFRNRRMHEAIERATMQCNLAYDARADVRSIERRNHEYCFETRREMAIHESHLKLVFEIAHRSQ